LTLITDCYIQWLMKLDAYLKLTGLTEDAFGKKIGVSATAVNHWRNGARTPRVAQMQKIFRVTEGAIAPSDFIAMPPRGDGAVYGAQS